jgi:hypothetical protein
MKPLLSFTCALLILSLASCSKNTPVADVPDEIIYSGINKTIVNIHKDSVPLACGYVVFEIYKDSLAGTPDSLAVRIVQNSAIIVGDCGNSFLNKSVAGVPEALNTNTVISDVGVWGTTNGKYNLKQFTGRGEKYLGILTESFNGNVMSKRYGWIRINCSAGNDSLKIMDWAYNNTAYKSIKAGQTP